MSIRRTTLSKRLRELGKVVVTVPKGGWVAELRELLGMRGAQLAQRIGISQPSLTRLEQAEREGAITIAKLRQLADALECNLYYAFIPRRDLDDVLFERAKAVVARERMHIRTTMALENQLESDSAQENSADELLQIADLIKRRDRRLWDED